jgi:hypothetical protein
MQSEITRSKIRTSLVVAGTRPTPLPEPWQRLGSGGWSSSSFWGRKGTAGAGEKMEEGRRNSTVAGNEGGFLLAGNLIRTRRRRRLHVLLLVASSITHLRSNLAPPMAVAGDWFG